MLLVIEWFQIRKDSWLDILNPLYMQESNPLMPAFFIDAFLAYLRSTKTNKNSSFWSIITSRAAGTKIAFLRGDNPEIYVMDALDESNQGDFVQIIVSYRGSDFCYKSSK